MMHISDTDRTGCLWILIAAMLLAGFGLYELVVAVIHLIKSMHISFQ